MLGALQQEQIEDVLRSGLVGRLGLHADGRTYVVPVTYAYDGVAVVGHTGEGLKVRMARANPRVCFEVDLVDNMANWRSVIAWGRFEELHGPAAGAAMQLLMSRFLPLMTSESAQPSHGLGDTAQHRADTAGRHAVVYRIVLDEKTGRFEKR